MADQVPNAQATPDFGSLGPSSDLQAGKPIAPKPGNLRPVTAALMGVLGAFAFMAVKGPVTHGAWGQISKALTAQGMKSATSRLDGTSAQHQAEYLLQQAINHDDSAVDKILQYADGWRGKIKLDTRLNSLFMTAIDAPDLRVRGAAIEIYLATQAMPKTLESSSRLLEQLETGDKTTQVWALYALRLLANRGVESDQITQILISKLQDTDPDLRHWAVEGLAYIGTDGTIAPLLKSFHDDPSAFVRERAGCALAESGMLTREQRRSAIPTLLDDAEDLSLGADTRSWAFQALRDISGQNLPNEPIAWRNWYSSQGLH
jgi:HEAT repeat protein